jgi:hypothetical protein
MKITALAAALCLLLPAAAPAEDVPLPPPPVPRKPARVAHRLAVLDFTLAGSAHPDLARVLSDAAAAGAAAEQDHQVLSQGEIVALLGLERTRQMIGCTEDSGCMAELAGALDSDRLLSGSLTILERTSLVTVRLIEVKKSRTLARVTATLLDATEAELVDAARRLGHEALTGKKLDTTGTLRIAVDRAGATVTLDGKALGESPLKEHPRVLEGPHTITVQKAGYVRWSTTVQVAAGGTVPVEVDLVPIVLLGEAARSRLWTWGWVSSGVAVAAGASAVYFGAQSRSAHQDYVKATNRSQAVDLADKTRTNATLANVSWGVAGAATVGAGYLLYSAMVEDARAARPPDAPPAAPPKAAALAVPIEGGAMLTVSGRF